MQGDEMEGLIFPFKNGELQSFGFITSVSLMFSTLSLLHLFSLEGQIYVCF